MRPVAVAVAAALLSSLALAPQPVAADDGFVGGVRIVDVGVKATLIDPAGQHLPAKEHRWTDEVRYAWDQYPYLYAVLEVAESLPEGTVEWSLPGEYTWGQRPLSDFASANDNEIGRAHV